MSTTKIQEKDLSQSLVDKIDNKASNEQLNNLQEEMNEVKKSVSDGKELVAGAITNKGVPTSGSDAYATMATNINSITTLDIGTSDATISAGDVLNGKVGYGKGGARVVGNMPNNSGATVGWSGYETITVQPHPQDSSQGLITISNQYGSRGYFDNTSKITGNMANLNAGNIKAGVAVGQVNGNSSNSIVGTFTSDANATASQILSGKTAYVNGAKITGTIPSQGAQTITPGTSNKTITSGKYLSGT